jgi:alkanesulfonate monooxygenase SsuD/methylene tetrahydromethanopterin reductase-like flavin-dependent oxidoreductase (luciferase family)
MLPVGYFACTQVPPNTNDMATLIDEIIEEAVVAESVGYDGLYFPEHHQQADAFIPNPVLLSALVGMHTNSIKVGPAVLLAPLYHPIRLAEDAALIDLATKGRFICALGIGYIQEDFDAFGIPTKERAPRTEECIEILRKAWSGEPFSYDSKFYQIENLRVTPAPYTKGGPPIWVGGWSRPGMERGGRLADAMIGDPLQSLEVIKEYVDQYREKADKYGRKPYYVMMRDCVIGRNREEALARSGPMMVKHRWYFEHGAYTMDEHLRDVKKPEDLTFDVMTKNRLIAGSPEECLDQLQMWRDEIQPDYVILRMRQATGPEQAAALEDIRLFGEKVIPHL